MDVEFIEAGESLRTVPDTVWGGVCEDAVLVEVGVVVGLRGECRRELGEERRVVNTLNVHEVENLQGYQDITTSCEHDRFVALRP